MKLSRAIVLAVLVVSPSGLAFAQAHPRAAAEFAAGWIGFADDGIVSEGMLGGAFRWHLTPRLSIGPELLYISGSQHSHVVATGNVTYDFRSFGSVVPFVAAGGGLYQTRENFFNRPYTSREGAFTAGGGIRARLTDQVFTGVDARIGWELHVRVNGIVGVTIR